MRRLLQRFVLATHTLLPFGPLYRILYHLAFHAFRFDCRRFPLIERVELRRGLTLPGWVPGSSDIDLALVIKSCETSQETAFLRIFWRRYRWWKACFPFLCEIQIATEAEAGYANRHGGLRGFRAGTAPSRRKDEGTQADLRFRWSCLAEALPSYLHLAQQTHLASSPEDDPAYGFKIAKGCLDALRFAAACRAGTAPLERRVYLKTLADLELRRMMEDPRRLDRTAARVACSRTLIALDQECRSFTASFTPRTSEPKRSIRPQDVWGEPLPPAESASWAKIADDLGRSAGGALRGCYFDSVYRAILLVDVSSPEALASSFGRLARLHPEDPAFQAPPWIVSKAVFQVLLWTPYLDSPFLYHALSPVLDERGLASRTRSRFPLLAGGQRVQWGFTSADFEPPPTPILRCSIALAASNLILSMRLFGLDRWAGDNSYRVCLLFGRLASAACWLETGIATDADDLDRLLPLIKQRLPEVFKSLEGTLLPALNTDRAAWNARSPAECFYGHYPAYRTLTSLLARKAASLEPLIDSATA